MEFLPSYPIADIRSLGLAVAHQWLVATELGQGVLPQPARSAEVLEAGLLTTEEGTSLGVAQAAE